MNQIVFYILLALIFLLLSYTLFSANKVSSSKAKTMIENGKIKHIIDVRTQKEWDLGHYEGAIHIPVMEISKKTLEANNIGKTDGILVYCNTGQRARYASDKIKQLGYARVYYIVRTYKSLE
jgi:rhodanese-related sulfurtransferase